MSPAACVDLLPACCTFIDAEYLGNTTVGRDTRRHYPSTPTWTTALRFRGGTGPDCDRLVAMLLAGIMDAVNTHYADLADSPMATRGAIRFPVLTPHSCHCGDCNVPATPLTTCSVMVVCCEGFGH